MPDVTLRRGRAKRADVRLWRTRYTPSATVVTVGSAIDPATQSLRGYWRASYTAAPWVGTASAGASASYDLATAGSDPTSGTAVNGFTPADFDGSFDYLIGAATGGGAATNFENHVSVGAGTISVLVKADTAATDAGAGLRVDNPGIVAEDTGGTCFTLGFSTAGATVAFFDTSATYKELTAAASTGQWTLIQCKWDGATLKLRVNNGSWQSIACGDLSNGALGWNVGKNYNVGYFDGQVLEVHMAQSALADATLDGIAFHLQNRYGLSLGFSSSSYTIPNTTVHPVLSRGRIFEGTANADVYLFRDPSYAAPGASASVFAYSFFDSLAYPVGVSTGSDVSVAATYAYDGIRYEPAGILATASVAATAATGGQRAEPVTVLAQSSLGATISAAPPASPAAVLAESFVASTFARDGQRPEAAGVLAQNTIASALAAADDRAPPAEFVAVSTVGASFYADYTARPAEIISLASVASAVAHPSPAYPAGLQASNTLGATVALDGIVYRPADATIFLAIDAAIARDGVAYRPAGISASSTVEAAAPVFAPAASAASLLAASVLGHARAESPEAFATGFLSLASVFSQTAPPSTLSSAQHSIVPGGVSLGSALAADGLGYGAHGILQGSVAAITFDALLAPAAYPSSPAGALIASILGAAVARSDDARPAGLLAQGFAAATVSHGSSFASVGLLAESFIGACASNESAYRPADVATVVFVASALSSAPSLMYAHSVVPGSVAVLASFAVSGASFPAGVRAPAGAPNWYEIRPRVSRSLDRILVACPIIDTTLRASSGTLVRLLEPSETYRPTIEASSSEHLRPRVSRSLDRVLPIRPPED